MQIPKTYLKDYEAYDREENTLINWISRGIISQVEYNKKKEELQNKYKNKIFPEDTHLFNNAEGLEKFLTDNNMPINQVEHEIQHATVAKQLGYTVKYGCQVLLNDNNTQGVIPFVKVLENITIEDYKKIVSAPDKLSKGDVEAINALK
jgi:hypothetical protein